MFPIFVETSVEKSHLRYLVSRCFHRALDELKVYVAHVFYSRQVPPSKAAVVTSIWKDSHFLRVVHVHNWVMARRETCLNQFVIFDK